MFQKLNLAIALSGMLLLPHHSSSAMDHPVKGEPGYAPIHRVAYPPVTIERIKEIFNNKNKRINKDNGKLNCVACAISLHNWINNQTEYPERIGKHRSTKNMACADDFAELIKQAHNEQIGSRVVRIDLENGTVTPLNATFDAITMELKGKHKTLEDKTLEDYMDQIPLKFTFDQSTRFRVALLYLIDKKRANTGHMVCVYKFIEEGEFKTYVIDPQLETYISLDEFKKSFQNNFINLGYIWYNKGENVADTIYRSNFVNIKDNSAIACQNRMEIGEDEAAEEAMEEDRLQQKRARDENSDAHESPKKRQTVKKEKESQAIEEDMEEDNIPPKRPRKQNLALNKTVAVKQEIVPLDVRDEDRTASKRPRKENLVLNRTITVKQEVGSINDENEGRATSNSSREENSDSDSVTTKKQKITERKYLTDAERKEKNRQASIKCFNKTQKNMTDEEKKEWKKKRSEYYREYRANLTPEEKQRRRESNRRSKEKNKEKVKESRHEYYLNCKKSMTDDQKENKSEYNRKYRENMSEDQKERVLESTRNSIRKSKQNMTQEQIKEKQEASRIYMAQRRKDISKEKKEKQLQARRDKRANMPEEQKKIQREAHRILEEKRRNNMSKEEKEKQLQARRDKLANMQKEKKEKQLQARRDKRKREKEENSKAKSSDTNPRPTKKRKT